MNFYKVNTPMCLPSRCRPLLAFPRHCLPKGNCYSHFEDQVFREADAEIMVQLGLVLVGGKLVEGQGSRGKRKEGRSMIGQK